ncbi:MAG: hypothetical protein KME17_27440 [Cyanosarcina radialis HA8281-LM2]|nr:hypothetical protein [Cyanosarcina radialis HA8281-LM2]
MNLITKSDTCYGQATPTALFLALAIDRMKPTPKCWFMPDGRLTPTQAQPNLHLTIL